MTMAKTSIEPGRTNASLPEERNAENPMGERAHCGIIMPISAMDDCDISHWKNVTQILSQAIETAGYIPRLVSQSDAVAIIQKTIVQNIHSNEIIVCDISCRNANVMFELGLRLAFDKPVVIVKDEQTPFPFDTGSIEHLTYPRSLSYWQILEFQSQLVKKITSTVSESKKPGYSPFLKHYGDIRPVDLPASEVTMLQYMEKRFDDMEARIDFNRSSRRDGSSEGIPLMSEGPNRASSPSHHPAYDHASSSFELTVHNADELTYPKINKVLKTSGLYSYSIGKRLPSVSVKGKGSFLAVGAAINSLQQEGFVIS